jgi:hypothetical protein
MTEILKAKGTKEYCDSCPLYPNYVNYVSFKSNNIQSPKDNIRM